MTILKRRPFAERARMGLATSNEIELLMRATRALEACYMHMSNDATPIAGSVKKRVFDILSAVRDAGLLEGES